MTKVEILALSAAGYTLTAAIAAIENNRPELLLTIAAEFNKNFRGVGQKPLNSQRLNMWARSAMVAFPEKRKERFQRCA